MGNPLPSQNHHQHDPDDGDIRWRLLVDHVFVISAGEITRAARNWLIGKLDQSQRRQIIFMDRDQFLDLAARILVDLKIDESDSVAEDDDIPF